VERGVGDLARDIPQGDIHRGQGVGQGAAAPEDVQFLLDFAHERSDA